MVTQNSQSTINRVYELLDLHPGVNLATRDNPPNEKYQEILFETAKSKLGVESIFFYRPRNDSVSVPYIFFYRLEGQNKAQLSKQLAELHKLAWNMGRAPLLFAALPDGQVRIYNAYEPPTEPHEEQDYQTGLIEPLNAFTDAESFRQYHRQELESGRFWQQHKERFDPKKRADQTLLQNLKLMRRELLSKISSEISPTSASAIVHSLLGRAIFIKYLEDRRDPSKLNVFPDDFFAQFFDKAACFTDVLDDKKATYKLFNYLNEKFNGDLFPISKLEETYINSEHLARLKLFLIGEANLSSHQLSFWKFYSFDVIPIEFISSIYEEFFHISEREAVNGSSSGTGTHYTPHHLVEFLVDEVLPWTGIETNFKTLDPACGSGIFLVEVYRRLIARWEQANFPHKIEFKHLTLLLTENIFGVDLDSSAIGVAAFSLYLTLCDFLEPRQIWEQVRFPELKQKNLFSADFFDDNQGFIAKDYNLILGNPPWKSKLTDFAANYIYSRKKTATSREFAPDNQIALTFLWRAAEFCTSRGEICFLMPSKGLLFNRSTKHSNFRQDFFATYQVKTVINFSACRHILFEKGDGPGAAVFYTVQKPDYDIPILYCSPKPSHSIEDKWQFIIGPQNITELPRSETIQNDIIWKVAMWGGPRDWGLVKKLTTHPYQTLRDVCDERSPKWVYGEGITVGKAENRVRDSSWLVGKLYLDIQNGDLDRFVVDENSLPIFDLPTLQWPRNEKPEIFNGPHIIVKQSPKVGESSLRAALLKLDTVFRHSFIGIHGSSEDSDLLAKCCLVLNSRIPFYFALMTSGRWLVERDELDQEEILRFPVPANLSEIPVTYSDLQVFSKDKDWETKVASLVEQLYDLTEEELILIDDAIAYTLDDFRRKSSSHSVEPTFSHLEHDKFLELYSKTAQKVLYNSFGRPFRSIVFQGMSAPLRVICFEPIKNGGSKSPDITYESSQAAFDEILINVDKYLIEKRSPSVFIQRHVRCYIGNTIYIIKPDQRRYWTRACALKDADEIYAEIMAN